MMLEVMKTRARVRLIPVGEFATALRTAPERRRLPRCTFANVARPGLQRFAGRLLECTEILRDDRPKSGSRLREKRETVERPRPDERLREPHVFEEDRL